MLCQFVKYCSMPCVEKKFEHSNTIILSSLLYSNYDILLSEITKINFEIESNKLLSEKSIKTLLAINISILKLE